MDKKEFKKAVTNVLTEYGFVTKGKIQQIKTDELIIVVSTQKSNFENCYYINYGFLVKELWPETVNPQDSRCDLFGRFDFVLSDNTSFTVDFENLTIEDFSSAFKTSIEKKIVPVIRSGINAYFEMYPEALCALSIQAKNYLGLI